MTLVAVALLLGHVGSPDVFYEGSAGPYPLFVSIRTPPVVPGVATIEIRASSALEDVSVVPMRLSGPGSKLPPTPDHAERSAADPHFFTANLWIMERGAMQVRVKARGPNGGGELAVPVPSVATRVLPMTKELGGLLFGLMVLLGVAAISITSSFAREALLEPGAEPDARDRRRGLIAGAIAVAVVGALIIGGRAWWKLDDDEYAQSVYTPPIAEAKVEAGRLELRHRLLKQDVLPDHGHPMHLFVVRESFDEVFHLHPERDGDAFAVTLPTVRGGKYRLFADIVTQGGFPITFTSTVELPAGEGPALSGDDSGWNDAMQSGLKWTEPARPLRSGVASAFRFESPGELEPYMGMAGHAVFIRKDFGVFAHVHPIGSVAMPALELANESLGGPSPHAGHVMDGPLPPVVSFPYGVPSPGDYRVFVQVKRNGQIETGVFDAHAD
jgi:hypothetical protein